MICIGLAMPARAQEEARSFRLFADEELMQSGLLAHILPRFTLKTGRRVDKSDGPPDMRLHLVPEGREVFARGQKTWRVQLLDNNSAANRFADWMLSEIGQNTIASFSPTDGPAFTAVPQAEAADTAGFEGDAALGGKVAALHCGRCHRVVVGSRRMSIGSTPSFMALRAMPDWIERFSSFYARNPHPSFMQITGLSPDFDPAHPPAIHPVTLSLQEVEALQAYVSAMAPADLGAPVAAN
jgi:hypothetical protein